VPLQAGLGSHLMQGGIISCHARVGQDLPLVIIEIIEAKGALGICGNRISEARIIVQALNYES